jgi:hypothetical protein
MTNQMNQTQKLYQDAQNLHAIHIGRKIRRDRYEAYWEDSDLIE